MEIYLKTYRRNSEVVVAACDKEILGKEFMEGEFQLNVDKGFYCGELTDLSELSNALKEASIASLTGNNVVDSAVKQGFVDEDCVLEVAGVKHAQIVVMPLKKKYR